MKELSEKIKKYPRKYQDLEPIIINLQKDNPMAFSQDFMTCPTNCPELKNCYSYLNKFNLGFFNRKTVFFKKTGILLYQKSLRIL